jgi:3-hydroxyisobutyrate dehydrogenase-like beta-hydroxyacid dehydrogenase
MDGGVGGVVGLLHPGEMGAAIGALLRARGREVLWASAGRGPATARRAETAGLTDAGTVAEVARRGAVVLSVCPPHAAAAVAAEAADAGFTGLFVDANAVAPATARGIAATIEAGGGRCVDGGIIGGPPTRAGTTRLYVSGAEAGAVRDLFDGTPLDTRVVGGEAGGEIGREIGAASALKMAYAGFTKGGAALLLAVRALARAEGVEAALLDEWALSQPDLPGRLAAATRSADAKGWRWIGEMEEIAAAMAARGLPDGFHLAAAAVYQDFRDERDAGLGPGRWG